MSGYNQVELENIARLEKENALLKEQIRVADVAFQGLHEASGGYPGIAAKDAEIAKLKASFQQSTEARTGWLNEFDGYKLQILELRQRLSEARIFIECIGTTGVERTDIILRAQRWLEKTP